jgi:hypothetical protein
MKPKDIINALLTKETHFFVRDYDKTQYFKSKPLRSNGYNHFGAWNMYPQNNPQCYDPQNYYCCSIGKNKISHLVSKLGIVSSVDIPLKSIHIVAIF